MTGHRYHQTGQDNWTPRQFSGLTREQIHGPLQPMQDDEPPSFTARFCYGVGAFAIAYGLYHVVRAIGAANLWFVTF